MKKHSININILGRVFPAVVDDEEAAVIKEAESLINAKIKSFKTEYRTQEDLNIVIMCCLELATSFLKYKTQQQQASKLALHELTALEDSLDQSLQQLDPS